MNELRRVAALYPLVYVQIGIAFAVLESEIIAGLGFPAVDAEVFATGSPDLGGVSHIAVTGVERFAATNPELTLGMLRAACHNAMQDGIRICLISKIPRMSFPQVPGSSLLTDAAPHFVQLLHNKEVLESQASEALSPVPTVGLTANCASGAILEKILRDIGEPFLLEMDRVVFELSSAAYDILPRLSTTCQEALRSSGLISVNAQSYEFFLSKDPALLRRALANSLSHGVVASAEFIAAAGNLYRIERTLRLVFRSVAHRLHGESWTSQLLTNEVRDRILERAVEEAYPTAAKMTELRDPAEWLTFGELLDLLGKLGLEDFGCDANYLRRLRRDLAPIRNRVAHMRFARSDDAQVSQMWLREIRGRFQDGLRMPSKMQ